MSAGAAPEFPLETGHPRFFVFRKEKPYPKRIGESEALSQNQAS